MKDKNRQSEVKQTTKSQRSEEERKVHLHFLESLEQINQAIKQETDIEQMLRDVIMTVFNIFECDRAWLLYPCDPDTPSFQVPVEVNRPEYPGAGELNLEVPMGPGQVQDMRDALASEGPVMPVMRCTT